MGLDASVVERVDRNPRLKARFGPWYFAQSAIDFLARYVVRPPRLEVEVDGRKIRGVSAFVQNGDPYTFFQQPRSTRRARARLRRLSPAPC